MRAFTTILLAAAFLPAAAGLGADRDVERHLRTGDRAMAGGDLEAAGAAFEAALEADPESADAHYALGVLAMRRHQYAMAVTHLQAAHRLYVESAADGLADRAEQRLHRDTYVRDLFDLAAGGASGSRNFGGGRRMDFSCGVSWTWYEGAAAGPEDLEFRMGACLLRLNRPAEALRYLLTAVERTPEAGAAHLNLAICEAALGDRANARLSLDRAAALGATVPDELRRSLAQ